MKAEHWGVTIVLGALTALAACSSSTSVVDDGGSGGAGVGGNGAGGTASIDTQACLACAEQACAAQASSCDSTAQCAEVTRCVLSCTGSDANCAADCAEQFEDASQAVTAAAAYAACALSLCPSECVVVSSGVGGTGGVGVGGSPGFGGSPEPSGGSGGTSGSGNGSGSGGTGGDGSGGIDGSGGSPGSGGSGGLAGAGGLPPIPGANWLTVDEDWADPAAEPNSSFGISGVFYAFADSCAELNWDPLTRCASGRLCDPGPSYSNWGVAVGFDFRNTGELGTPPEAKLAWDATAVNATGLAWSLRGRAPGLQVWVTNMDPAHGGVCELDACSIEGPPDGLSTPGLQDWLLFSSMEKDYWGGGGLDYEFDPANIDSVQFKLSSLVAGAQSFEFCVDGLGVIE